MKPLQSNGFKLTVRITMAKEYPTATNGGGGGVPRTSGGITGAAGRNVNPVNKLSPSAENSIAEARKALGSTKPSPEEMVRRNRANTANDIARIRNQGRNTR